MNFIWKKFIWRLFESYIQRRYSYNNIIIISITKQLITNTTYYQKLQYHDYLVKFKQFSLLIKKNFTMIFLFRNLITQFSYSISRLFMKMEHCVGSLFDDERKACKFFNLGFFHSRMVKLDAAGSCTNLYLYKKRSRALMGIIKKLPISGNRLAFCRLPGLAERRRTGFSLDRLKSLARPSFHFLEATSSIHRS